MISKNTDALSRLAILLLSATCTYAQANPPAQRCADALKWTTDTLRIDAADDQSAGTMPGSPATLPARCRVRGKISPYIGSGGKEYAIGFELQLPYSWNGELLFQGGGGLNGSVMPAVGPMINRGSDATLLSHHGAKVFSEVAPKDANGAPILLQALSAPEWNLVRKAVLNACDALDGASDGMIFNHRDRRFDPAILQCKPQQSADCLGKEKVTALQQAFAGPRDANGKPIAGEWPFDAGIAEGGYLAWRIGSVGRDGKPGTPLVTWSDLTLTKFMNYPQIPSVAFKPIDYGAMQRQIAPTALMTDATSTDLTTFAARGGKIILVTGWSDPVFTPIDLTNWYERLTSENAATTTPADTYARLFMVPGMNHCGGGPALDNFAPLTAIIEWTENGKAPVSINATGKAFPGISRPLCAYPKFAHYSGSGATDSAASYRCE